MSLKLFTISSMYPGFLESFYRRNPHVKESSYNDLYATLLNDSTEFVGSYTRAFIKLGVYAGFTVANDPVLLNKWKSKYQYKSASSQAIIFDQVKRFQPEILLIEDLGYTPNDLLINIRENVKSVKLIIAFHCSPFSQKIVDRLKSVDFTITCTPGFQIEIQNMGYKSYLVYHGFDKEILNRIGAKSIEPNHEFVFSGSLLTGSGYHSSRIELIEKILDADLNISLYSNLEKKYKIAAKQTLFHISEFLRKSGISKYIKSTAMMNYGGNPIKGYSPLLLMRSHKPVYGLEMYKLLYNSKIVLNFHIGVTGNYGGNMRLFEATGTGSCLLTDNKANLDQLFEPGKEIIVYEDAEDCIKKAKWLLENDSERIKIAEAGQKRTMENHTVENRCQLILDIISSELGLKRN